MALHIVTFSIAASQVAERSKIAEFCIVEGWTNCEAFFVTPWAISLVAGVVSVAANANFYYQFYHKKAVSSTRRFVGNTLSIGLWLPAVIIGFLPISPEKSIGAFRVSCRPGAKANPSCQD